MCEHFSAERDENVEGTDRLFRDFGVPEELRARQRAVRERWAEQDPLCDATRIDRRLRGGERGALQGLLAPGDPRAGPHRRPLPVSRAGFRSAPHRRPPDGERGSLHRQLPRSRVRPIRSIRCAGRPASRGCRSTSRACARCAASTSGCSCPPTAASSSVPAAASTRPCCSTRCASSASSGRCAASRPARSWATAWQVWEQLFPKADPVTQMRTRMYMVIGALDLLEAEGRVEARWGAAGALEHRPAGAPAGSARRGEQVDR